MNSNDRRKYWMERIQECLDHRTNMVGDPFAGVREEFIREWLIESWGQRPLCWDRRGLEKENYLLAVLSLIYREVEDGFHNEFKLSLLLDLLPMALGFGGGRSLWDSHGVSDALIAAFKSRVFSPETYRKIVWALYLFGRPGGDGSDSIGGIRFWSEAVAHRLDCPRPGLAAHALIEFGPYWVVRGDADSREVLCPLFNAVSKDPRYSSEQRRRRLKVLDKTVELRRRTREKIVAPQLIRPLLLPDRLR